MYSLRFSRLPPGELPPPAPRDCFGRDKLIEKIVGFAENLEPIALIGAGGTGKTSIALTVLHHNRISERFGDNRRFIRCDQFPASPAHLLARLSEVIGAQVEHPKNLSPLRPLLSSKEMLIILDNAESVLDPQGTDAKEIYSLVDELCQFKTVCLLITSRITTVPPRCLCPEIPTLSMGAACDIFYNIYDHGTRSGVINNLLRRLDFHPLSITLLATTASHNAWDYHRLANEWDTKRAQVLKTHQNMSLAATIELSLASPTFCSLGPDARDLLGVVAFFPQGIDESNFSWLFPTIYNRKEVFDKFCLLSLAYRSHNFVTMLAPIRDYLSPRDPQSSPLLCATRDLYLRRLSVGVSPSTPGFGAARWIVFEDVNVEHLLDVFSSIDPENGRVWDACCSFMRYLYWYKPRQTVLRPKIEALPDYHRSKSTCLSELSRLFGQVGNCVERKRLLNHVLELERRSGDNFRVALTLQSLSDANLQLGLYQEGIRQGTEALGILERVDHTMEQANCLSGLAWLFFYDKQLDAAEDVASRAIDLVTTEGREYNVCQLHRILGKIFYAKGEKKKAIHHFGRALGIASPSNWRDELFWIHHDMAELLVIGGELDDASVHIERAKPYIDYDSYKLGRAMHVQAAVWYRQSRLEDATSEASCALEIYEKSGAVYEVVICRKLLRKIERAMKKRPSFQGKLSSIKLHVTPVNL